MRKLFWILTLFPVLASANQNDSQPLLVQIYCSEVANATGQKLFSDEERWKSLVKRLETRQFSAELSNSATPSFNICIEQNKAIFERAEFLLSGQQHFLASNLESSRPSNIPTVVSMTSEIELPGMGVFELKTSDSLQSPGTEVRMARQDRQQRYEQLWSEFLQNLKKTGQVYLNASSSSLDN